MRNKWIAIGIIISLLFSSGIIWSAPKEDVTFYHCDALGTPIAMTNMQGNVVWRGNCLPFGEDFNGEGTRDTEIRYTGKPYNPALGLYDFGARYYDPNVGRFTSTDPVMGDISDSQRLNSYAYGLNSPYKYVDPDGGSPVAVYAYFVTLTASPDFQYDMQSLTVSSAQFFSAPTVAGAIDVGLDVMGLAIPGVPGSGLKAAKKGTAEVVGEMHHIATNKAVKSGFKKQFEAIFSKAGMNLEDSANKVFLEGHRGGHTKKYKEYVLDKLKKATDSLEGQAYNDALIRTLDNLKKELLANPKMPYKGGM